MTTHKSSRSPAETGNDAPPNWLTRPEKIIFRRVSAERRAAENPLSAMETNFLADFCLSRTRIRELNKMLSEAFHENSDLQRDRDYVLQLSREIDRTVAICEKLADRLGSRASRLGKK